MSKYLSILFLCCLPAWLWAGENYRFRVYLKDKGDDGYRVRNLKPFFPSRRSSGELKMISPSRMLTFPYPGRISTCCLKQV